MEPLDVFSFELNFLNKSCMLKVGSTFIDVRVFDAACRCCLKLVTCLRGAYLI